MHPDRFELCPHCGNVGRVREPSDGIPVHKAESPKELERLRKQVHDLYTGIQKDCFASRLWSGIGGKS